MEYAIETMGLTVMCEFFLLLLFLLNYRGRKIKLADPLLCCYIVLGICMLLASLWMYIDGNPSFFFWNAVLNIAYFPLMISLAVLWLLHILEHMAPRLFQNKRFLFLLSIPYILVSLLCVFSVKNGLVYWIDPQGNYRRGPIFHIVSLTMLAYVGLASVLVLYNYLHAQNSRQKHACQAYLSAVIPPLFISIARFVLGFPLDLTYLGLIFSLLVVYAMERELYNTNDPATGLYNRYALESFMERFSKRANLWLLVGTLPPARGEGEPSGVIDKLTEACDRLDAKPAYLGNRRVAVLLCASPEQENTVCADWTEPLSAIADLHWHPFDVDKTRSPLETLTAIEVQYLRLEADAKRAAPLEIRCFGNFEMLADGKPLTPYYSKSKELMAYLITREGSAATTGEMMAVLFEDDEHKAYFQRIRADLISTLKDAGYESVLVSERGKLAVRRDAVHCDYYDYLEGNKALFHGEFMSQYSWAEDILALMV